MQKAKITIKKDLKDEKMANKGYIKLAKSGVLSKVDSKKVMGIARDEADHHRILTKIMKKPLMGKRSVIKKKGK